MFGEVLRPIVACGRLGIVCLYIEHCMKRRPLCHVTIITVVATTIITSISISTIGVL